MQGGCAKAFHHCPQRHPRLLEDHRRKDCHQNTDTCGEGRRIAKYQRHNDPDNGQQENPAGSERFLRRRDFILRRPQIVFHCAEVHLGKHAHIVQQRRNKRGKHDRIVRDTRILCHDEGSRTHNRRHGTAPRGRRNFNRTRKPGLIAQALHHRDRDGPRGHNIRGWATRHGSIQTRRNDGDLCRAASCAPGDQSRQVEKEVPSPSLGKESPEHHEQEDVTCHNLKRDTEQPICGEDQNIEQIAELADAMPERRRQKIAKKVVNQEQHHNACQPQASCPARGFDGQEQQ